MSILFYALTVSTLGKVLLAVGVILAHMEIAKERKIDDLVVKYIRIEYMVTIVGLLMIITGYFFELRAFHSLNLLQI